MSDVWFGRGDWPGIVSAESHVAAAGCTSDYAVKSFQLTPHTHHANLPAAGLDRCCKLDREVPRLRVPRRSLVAMFSLGALALAPFVTQVLAGALPVSLVSVTSPVAPFTDATIRVRTAPAASCRITVLYKSGPSRAQGLFPKDADMSGQVVWLWRVGSNTTPGRWPIIVACNKGQDEGQLETAFDVRD